MITCDGVVHGFPQPFDLIHPKMVDGLEEQFELEIVGQPALHSLGLVNDRVGRARRHMMFNRGSSLRTVEGWISRP